MGIFKKSVRQYKVDDKPKNNFNVGDDDYMSYSYGLDYMKFSDSVTPSFHRSKIYKDVDFIDMFDEVVGKYITDIAQDATQYSVFSGSSVWVSSDNKEVKKILDSLLDRLQISERSTAIVRSMVKYGDKFARVIIDPRKGISALKDQYHPSQVIRMETAGELIGYKIAQDEKPLERYEVIHWMTPFQPVIDDILYEDRELRNKYILDENPTYGFSELWKVISVSKRIKYVEDAMILARLSRSRMYRVHKVEVGNATIAERTNIMRRYIKNWTKTKGENYTNSDAFSEMNQLSFDEDRYFPISNGKGDGNIEQMGGNSDVKSIVDVEHLLNKRARILGLPEEGETMTNRLQNDTKYARRVATFQRAFIAGLEELCDIELGLHGKYSVNREYSISMVDVDSFVQSEQNDMLASGVDFAERILSIADQTNSVQLGAMNRSYLTKYLFENFLKLPGMELEKLFAGSDKEENKSAMDELVARLKLQTNQTGDVE